MKTRQTNIMTSGLTCWIVEFSVCILPWAWSRHKYKCSWCTARSKVNNNQPFVQFWILFMCHYGKTLVKYIGGVIANVIALNMIGRGFESQSDQTKDYKIGICCFSAKHTTLRSNIKYYLTMNQENVFERSDMPFCGLLFQSSSTKILQRSILGCAVWRRLSIGTTVIGTNNHHSQFYFMWQNSF